MCHDMWQPYVPEPFFKVGHDPKMPKPISGHDKPRVIARLSKAPDF